MSIKLSDNIDVVGRISRDLENEGINLSNDKIAKVMNALKQLVKVYYQVHSKNKAAYPDQTHDEILTDISSRLQAQLQMRANLKEGIIQALVTCLQTVVKG